MNVSTELADYFSEAWAGYSSFTKPQITELAASAFAGTKARLVLEAQNSSAFISLSPQESPDLVADDVEKISRARSVLGPELSSVAPEVLFFGRYEGRSVAAFELLNELPDNRLARKIQKVRVGSLVSNWVDHVALRTIATRSLDEFESHIEKPLSWLIANGELSPEVRHAAEVALESLEADPTQAKSVFMHGDIWWGNIMLPSSALQSSNKFHLIDWGGAQQTGYPVYDLVRTLDAVAGRGTQAAIDRHLSKLGIDREQGLAHLLCAVGSFGAEGGQLTPVRARELVHSCVDIYTP